MTVKILTDPDALSREQKIEYIQLLEEKNRRKRENRVKTFYPDTGKLRRELYKKHLAFFCAGKKHRERAFIAANRVGKTEGVGCYEMTLHLTGDYPNWWQGRRFNRPIQAWAAGDTTKTVREILQDKLLGKISEIGTGLIPKAAIEKIARSSGVADSVEIVYVRHISGGTSKLVFKSYDQRREAFQGTEQDVILLDEEPPVGIYTECLIRTMTNNGMLMLTFTPLMGMSEVVLSFMPGGIVPEENNGSKFLIMADWDDVPHLSDEVKKELWASIPPHQRDARSKGVPSLGSGAIYQVSEEDIVVDDFEVPAHWPKAYALDVGWNRTAAIWGAVDRETDTVFLYSEHYRGQAEPVIHAQAIKSRGDWIPGVIDPASSASNQKDGEKLIEIYRKLGLVLSKADNTVDAGIGEVWGRLSTGRLKVFKSLSNWRSEFRLYRRDEKGRIVKENDHLMDAMRYLIMSGLRVARQKPQRQQARQTGHTGSNAWMIG